MTAKKYIMPHIVPEQRIEIDGRETIVRRRTVPQYEAALGLARQRNKDGSKRRHASCKPASDWHGDVTNAGYEKMLREGWPEGIDGAEGLEGLASDCAERISFTRDVGGAFANVPAYLSGAPDAMYRPRTDTNENVRGVTLVIDASFHAGINGSTVLDYARKVMRLVSWLEAERIETAVYTVHTAVYNNERVMHICPIREAGQLIQPERLASIVHPAWLRRAQFAILEYDVYELGHHNGSLPWGYGSPSHSSIAELQAVLPEAYSVIMLPKVGAGDPEKAIEETLNLKLRREE